MTPENPPTPSSVAIGQPQGPIGLFHYCPRCGTERPSIEGSRALRCGNCGLLLFFNSAAAAGAFVFHQGQLILCVRSREPGKGLLGVPGGFLEFDETVEDGLRREIYEELHIEVDDLRYLLSSSNNYAYAGVPYKTTDLFFVCEAPDISGIQPADDVADYLLIDPDDLDPARFAFASARIAFTGLREWLKQRS